MLSIPRTRDMFQTKVAHDDLGLDNFENPFAPPVLPFFPHGADTHLLGLLYLEPVGSLPSKILH